MKAIVTGGAGFVGSHLVEMLVARGVETLVIERPGASRGWIEGLPVAWDTGGVADAERLERLFAGADVVFHLAALTEAKSPEDFYAVNTEGTNRVMRAAAAQPRPPRVIFMSTLAAAGPCRDGENLGSETVPYPLSVYGHSKLLAEAVVHAHAGRVPSVILRFPSIYGPRERAVLKLFHMVKRGFAMTVGGWDREVSLIYVDDAVAALLAAAEHPDAVGRTFVIAHPEPVTWARFARTVGFEVGRVPVLLKIPVAVARLTAWCMENAARLRGRAAVLNRDRVRELSQDRWVCDPSLAMQVIGFHPLFPLDLGVPLTAAWYRMENWL